MHKSAQDDYFFNILWTADGKKRMCEMRRKYACMKRFNGHAGLVMASAHDHLLGNDQH